MLTDTLLGTWRWRPRAKVKEVAHPKFYLFDCGVRTGVAGCASRSMRPSAAPYWNAGVHELRAHLAYAA